ncbi:transposase [Gammaproteobacteria bacterium]
MTYSADFRERVLQIRENEGLTYVETARRFRIGTTSLVRWEGGFEPKLTRNKPPTKINMEALKQDVEQYPDAYQYERAKRFGVSQSGIGSALKRLGISCKKVSRIRKQTARPKKFFKKK